ncbi:MAG: hypothetical protein M1822_009046 [Bathelium mastoideum]|nr:MAG: hypothetical protein M1822_009046 [Bathelium mastoideum]
MASLSVPPSAQGNQRVPKKTAAVGKATRRSDRIRAANRGDSKFRTNTKQQAEISIDEKKQASIVRSRTPDINCPPSVERPKKRPKTQDPSNPHEQFRSRKRSREDVTPPFHSCLERSPKRVRTNRQTISEARLGFWTEEGKWPTEEQERTMDRFRDLVQHALPRKRSKSSLCRKRSDTSVGAGTVRTRTPSDQHSREQKSAPYRHPRYEGQLQEHGSYMDDHDEGITKQGEELLAKLLKTPRKPPKDTLFSDDSLFKKTCRSLRGENETKVILRIAGLIFPSAEILALRGSKHLEILRETTNAGWINAIPFLGPRPQPDFGLGFKREAFNREQLQRLRTFIGNELEDCSYIAATYNMYFPFFTSEVKCGASALDVADRQNLHSQTISLRNLAELFKLVGRLNELHREVNSYSISHTDEYVRIWAHYLFIKGKDYTFHRRSVAKFDISPTVEGDQRWKAWTFTMNVFDLWVPDHFKRICSVIDMLPVHSDFELSDLSQSQQSDPELASSRSGLSQQVEGYSLADEEAVPDSQFSNQPITPNTTTTGSSDSKKKRAK